MMKKGFNLEMIVQLYDWEMKEVTNLEAFSKTILDFTELRIENKL